MRFSIPAALLLCVSIEACVVYEYEHEFWLRVDGSGSVNITGRPELWSVFKGIEKAEDPDGAVARAAIREVFDRSGLRVRRMMRTRRAGRTYVFIAADFKDVNRLSRSPAFPDLDIELRRENDRLRLQGTWYRPPETWLQQCNDQAGMVAVRFHLPSKVYEHKNAFGGVERGNIVGWRESLADALERRPLVFGAVMDERSILSTTIWVFVGSFGGAVLVLTLILYFTVRKGRQKARLTVNLPSTNSRFTTPRNGSASARPEDQ